MTSRTLFPKTARGRIRLALILVLVVALVAAALFFSQTEVTAECGGPAIDAPIEVSQGEPPVTVQTRPLVEMKGAVDAVLHPETGDWYIAVKAGELVRFDGVSTETLVDMTEEVSKDLEQGLLGLAVAPAGDTLYAYYTDLTDDSHLLAFDIDDGVFDTASRREIYVLEQPTHEHNAGDLEFGPDGRLYMSLGDGGEPERAQDPSNWFGAIVALDVSGPLTPTGDGAAPLAEAELMATGLRNPWRFSIDDVTGDIWIGDVGDDCFEEIDVVPGDSDAAPNFGWPGFEGFHEHEGDAGPDPVPPLHEFDHVTRCSVSGGVVYRGSAIPQLTGSYVFADFCSAELFALTENDDGTWTESGLGVPIETIASIVEDADGELVVVSMTQGLHSIVP